MRIFTILTLAATAFAGITKLRFLQQTCEFFQVPDCGTFNYCSQYYGCLACSPQYDETNTEVGCCLLCP
jgi:hypothetical protein